MPLLYMCISNLKKNGSHRSTTMPDENTQKKKKAHFGKRSRGVANFGEIFEKSEIGVQIFFFTWGFFFPLPGGEKTVFCGISEPIPGCGGGYTEKWTDF